MKKICYFLLLFYPGLLFSQSPQELKLDLFQGALRTAFLSYEIAPSKHFGLEFGLGHEWGKIGYVINREPAFPVYQSFSQNIGQVLVLGKYYPSSRANADRWFVGAYFLEKFELNHDPEFDTSYQKEFGKAPSVDKNIWSGLGGTVGLKKVYKSGILLEFAYSVTVNMDSMFFVPKDERTFDFGGTVQGKIGYRFGSSKKEKTEKG